MGRKALGNAPQDAGIYIRCDQEQKAALEAHLIPINEERIRRGQKRIPLSTWIREYVLLETGNTHLTRHGKALAEFQNLLRND